MDNNNKFWCIKVAEIDTKRTSLITLLFRTEDSCNKRLKEMSQQLERNIVDEFNYSGSFDCDKFGVVSIYENNFKYTKVDNYTDLKDFINDIHILYRKDIVYLEE